MKLIEEWKATLYKAWSMWLAYMAAIFAVLDVSQAQLIELLPVLKPMLTDVQFGYLSLLCTVLIPVARVVDQGIKAAKAAQ